MEGNPIPVVQLQDQGGLGTLIGMAGGYLLGNPARKAAQAQRDVENKRNATQDAATAARDKDLHDETVSRIREATAASDRTTTNDVNAQFQQAANAKANNLLASPPQGQDPAQWAQHVWQQATTPPSSGGLGLTDSKMLGDLYAQVQNAVTKAAQAKQQQFLGKETKTAMPGDMKQRLNFLMNHRLPAERAAGIDPKDTMAMITDTQKQIADAQAAAYHAQTTAERQRHDAAVENRPHAPRAPGMPRNAQGLTPEDVIQNAHWDAEHPKGGKPKTGPPGAGDWTTIKDSATVKSLAPVTKASLQQGVDAYGAAGAAQHLTNAIKSGKYPPGFNADSAQAALDALNGNGN